MNKISSKFNLPLFLRIMEVTLTVLMLFPVTYSCTLFLHGGTQSDLGFALTYTFLYIGIAIFCFMLSKIPPFKFKEGTVKFKVLSAVCKVALMIATLVVFTIINGFVGITFAILAVIAVFFGLFNGFCSISFSKLFYFAILNALQFIFFMMFNYNMSKSAGEDFVGATFNSDANIWFFLFFFVVTMFYNNQTNITVLMDRRGHDQGSMPKQMRTYNLFLVSVISSIVVILVTLREQFSALLDYILHVIMVIVTFIVQKLFEVRNTGDTLSDSGTGTGGDSSGLVGAENTNEYGEFIAALFFMVIAILLINFIISRRKYILMSIIDAIEAFKQKIANLFKNTRTVDDSVHAMGGDFTDHVVSIRDEVRGTGLKKYKKRDWNKEYKKTTAIEDVNERYFSCYKLVVKWLELNGHKIKDGQTPLEVYNTTVELIGDSSWKNATDDYNLLMYKEEQITSENIEKLCKHLRQQKT